MQSCLYSLIAKSPTFTGTILYRFCVSEDKLDFKIGQHYTCPHSLTTTCDNWDKDTNRYIITPLPKSQTKAHSIFKIYNHGEENQVNFLPNTSFVITDIPQISLFCSMLALIPQSGDFSGATLGVRSVALLQVSKWSRSPQST